MSSVLDTKNPLLYLKVVCTSPTYNKNLCFSYAKKKIICISDLIIDDLLCVEGNTVFYIYDFFFFWKRRGKRRRKISTYICFFLLFKSWYPEISLNTFTHHYGHKFLNIYIHLRVICSDMTKHRASSYKDKS